MQKAGAAEVVSTRFRAAASLRLHRHDLQPDRAYGVAGGDPLPWKARGAEPHLLVLAQGEHQRGFMLGANIPIRLAVPVAPGAPGWTRVPNLEGFVVASHWEDTRN